MRRPANNSTAPYVTAINVISLAVLAITCLRVAAVLRGRAKGGSGSGSGVGDSRVPAWMPPPQQTDQSPWGRATVAVASAQGPEAAASMGQQQGHEKALRRETPGLRRGRRGATGESSESSGGKPFLQQALYGASPAGGTIFEDNRSWGVGVKVLIFTMDSLTDRVELAGKGGPAGEIKIRESLTKSLVEAGAEVEVAVSDRDFERKAISIDDYDAIFVDPWTWAGKGWRLKPQLVGQQHKMFVLDFFGADKPHHNLGVPTTRHLTAFPVPSSQSRTFLGYRVDPSQMPPANVRKKRQGVIWGKTPASFEGPFVRTIVSHLADRVELHSTVAPKDAPIRHKNIIYHGVLSRQEWQRLLQESKFMIGLGDPVAGPSAVDAVVAGCVYLNPVYSKPKIPVYPSQHPFMHQSVGEPHVCSFGQKDVQGAVECVEKALEQELQPMVPRELTKAAHDFRVRNILEPMLTAP